MYVARAGWVLVVAAAAGSASTSACSDPEPASRAEPAPVAASADDQQPSGKHAVRFGQCGYVEPGALRGGLQPMTLDAVDLGPGVALDLDTLQLQPVLGAWFCVVGARVVEGAPPPPRRPRDLGRFTMLREERRTIDPDGASDEEELIHLADPAWVAAVSALRARIEALPEAERAEACEEASRARVDPDSIRSEAVTAMRHYVATGQLRTPAPPDLSTFDTDVTRIAELCAW